MPTQNDLENMSIDQKNALLVEQINTTRTDLDTIVRQVGLLRENYPEEFQEINRKHPALSLKIEESYQVLAEINRLSSAISGPEITHAVNNYNLIAQEINGILGEINIQAPEGQQSVILENLEEQFTDTEKQEIRDYAKSLYDEIFPESNVEQFVRWTGEGEPLEDYQRVLVAPAVGLEHALIGVLNLFNRDTWVDFYNACNTLKSMTPEDRANIFAMLKTAYESASKTDVVAPIISFISCMLTIVGGASALSTLVKVKKLPACLTGVITTTRTISTITRNTNNLRALPLGVLGGMTLKYIDPGVTGSTTGEKLLSDVFSPETDATIDTTSSPSSAL